MLDILPILSIIEGALFASSVPLSVQEIKKSVCPDLSLGAIRDLLNQLQSHYAQRGIHLVEVASGYRFQIAPEVSVQLTPLLEEKPARLSRAFMETIAIIAYRQPITRPDIEAIRGVVVSTNIIKSLTELDWIKIVGYKEVPGKPALYATTKAFLDFFNLKSLENLPALTELMELKDVNACHAQLHSDIDLAFEKNDKQAFVGPPEESEKSAKSELLESLKCSEALVKLELTESRELASVPE